MKRNIFRMIALVTVGVTFMTAAAAQSRVRSSAAADQYLISAKAGGVNYTEGSVTVIRKDGTSGVLLNRDELNVGDRVETGANGKAEILLNPGSYMRLGAGSAFVFKTTTFDDLQIRIDRGTAMFEVFAANDFRVNIETPEGKVAIIETGVYRVDVSNIGTAEIAVFDGKAQLGDMKLTIVKKGRQATIVQANVAVSKFDRGNRGELGDWSKARSKDLAKMTSSLQNTAVRDSLVSSFFGGRWGMYESFGLWIFNPNARAYCFLPFGQGWYSPYGYGFATGLYWFNLPPAVFVSPVIAASTEIKDPKGRGDRRGRDLRSEEPPFQTIERKREPRQVFEPSIENDTDRQIRRTDPVMIAPVVVAPIVADPSTTKRRDN